MVRQPSDRAGGRVSRYGGAGYHPDHDAVLPVGTAGPEINQ